MRVGCFRFGPYTFTVFDDGSLACNRVWCEDPATAAREFSLNPDDLTRETIRVIVDWKNAVLTERLGGYSDVQH